MNNSIEKGEVRCIIFKENDVWYGVALEFNLVVNGDSPELVTFELNEAIMGYVEAARKSDNVDALNQVPDEEYANLWNLLQKKEPVPSPYQIYSYGTKVTCPTE